MAAPTEKELKELEAATVAAAERHIRHPEPFMPDYVPFVLDTDVALRPWHKTLHEGVYQMFLPKDGLKLPHGSTWADVPPECLWVWGMDLDLERFDAERGKLRLKLLRIDVADERPLTIHDVWLWLAVQDALEAGDKAGASRLVDIACGRSPSEGVTLDVPQVTAIRPRTHVAPNSKVTHKLTDPDAFEKGGISLDVGRKRGQTVIDFALSVEDGSVTLSKEIDAVDRSIISAVSTLKEAAIRETGEPVISAFNICEAMGVDHPEPQRQADVDRRMARLMGITARIDFTEQARQRKLIDPKTGLPYANPDTGLLVDGAVITGHLIEAVMLEGVDTGGNRFVRYRLTADPPTYEHAKAVNQVVTYPQRMLTLAPVKPDGTAYRRSSTERQTILKQAVLERVYTLKSKKSRMSNTVLYDTLCEVAGVDPSKRDARKNVADFTEAYLRALKNEGVIYDFQTHVEGRSHKRTGVDVFVKKP